MNDATKHITRKSLISYIIIILFIGFLTVSMLSDQKIHYLASAMSGQLINEAGDPAVGVTITRTWQTHTERGVATTTTDAAGRFTFDAVTRKASFLERLSLSTPVIRSEFTFDVDGKQQRFLFLTKRSYAQNGELDGQPIRVVCRVDAEATPGPGPILESTCRIEREKHTLPDTDSN